MFERVSLWFECDLCGVRRGEISMTKHYQQKEQSRMVKGNPWPRATEDTRRETIALIQYEHGFCAGGVSVTLCDACHSCGLLQLVLHADAGTRSDGQHARSN